MDVEVVNWRAIMGAPGITPEQRKAVTDTFDKMVKSKEWAEVLKTLGMGRLLPDRRALHQIHQRGNGQSW